MKILYPRTHQVSFRLSEEEYDHLRTYCASAGARSISDLARQAVCQLTDHPRRRDAALDVELRHLHEMFLSLSERVQNLSHLLEYRLVVPSAKDPEGRRAFRQE